MRVWQLEREARRGQIQSDAVREGAIFGRDFVADGAGAHPHPHDIRRGDLAGSQERTLFGALDEIRRALPSLRVVQTLEDGALFLEPLDLGIDGVDVLVRL